MKIKKKLVSRVLGYAKRTGIQFRKTGRFNHVESLGIPEMRGFNPHLRTVNLLNKQKKNLWVIHDLLHILFYDFASFYLGDNVWNDENRFYEVHLASEAFAVLALDYHILSFEKSGGLAVDVRSSHWKSFQKINPDLPSYLSPEFCEILLKLYLCGETQFLEAKRKKTKSYGLWLDHEIRYSHKQRYYVAQWWSDLHGLPTPKKAVSIIESHVHWGVWELLEKLIYKTDKEWAEWERVAKDFSNKSHYFNQFPKFNKKFSKYDFRFTDFESLGVEGIKKYLCSMRAPSASGLFLLWQILSQVPRNKIPIEIQLQIKALSQSSHGKELNVGAWARVLNFCKEVPLFVEKGSQKGWGTFYLP